MMIFRPQILAFPSQFFRIQRSKICVKQWNWNPASVSPFWHLFIQVLKLNPRADVGTRRWKSKRAAPRNAKVRLEPWGEAERHVGSFFFSVHFTASICHYETLQNNRESNKKLRGFPNCSRRGKVTASATKRSPCASRVHVCAHAGPSNPACCLQPARRKLLRPKEELLKQLLTSVSSADRHLVPAPGLPSYRTIARLSGGEVKVPLRLSRLGDDTLQREKKKKPTSLGCNESPLQ